MNMPTYKNTVRLSSSMKMIILILMLSFATAPLRAQHHEASIGELYNRLDSLIDNQHKIVAQKEGRMNSIRNILRRSHLSDKERYDANEQMFNEYARFKFDSALVYVNSNIALSLKMKSRYHYARSMMNKSDIMMEAGLTDEATKLLGRVDTTIFSNDDMVAYYNLHISLDLYKAEFVQGTEYSDVYIKELMSYRRRLLQIADPSSYSYIVTEADYACQKNDVDAAIRLLRGLLPTLYPGDRRYSIITGTLACGSMYYIPKSLNYNTFQKTIKSKRYKF